MRGGFLRRVFTCIFRRCAIVHLIGFKHRAVPILPRYGILVYGSGELCRVGHIARNGGDFRSPARKRVGVLRIAFLGRGITVIFRRCAIFHLIGFKHRAVPILPRYGVHVYCSGELCRVGCIARDFAHLGIGIPTAKRVGVLLCGRLGRGITVILRRCAVFHLLGFKHLAVPILPRYGVLVYCFGELRRVLRIACNGGDFRSPARKRVGVLRIAFLGRGCAVILRHCAVFNVFVRFKHTAVIILPRYGILIDRLLKYRCVGHIARDGGDFRSPALKLVGVLRIAFLGRFLAVIFRRCAVFNVFVLFKFRTVLIYPRYSEFLYLPLCIQRRILRKAYGCLVGIVCAAAVRRRVPAFEVMAFAGESVGCQLCIRTYRHGLRLHCAFAVIGIECYGYLGRGKSCAPYAIVIVESGSRVCAQRFGVATVRIMQLGSSDGDSHCTAVRIILICISFCAGCALLNVLAGSVAAANISAAFGSVDCANGSYAAVYIHLNINQVIVGAVVCLARRIRHGLKLAGAPDKVIGVPLIAVIEIDIFSVCDRQASALGNIDLNARQQSGILIDGHISGLNINCDIIGNGQHIACGVDTHTCKLQ